MSCLVWFACQLKGSCQIPGVSTWPPAVGQMLCDARHTIWNLPTYPVKKIQPQKKALLHPPQPFILFKTSWGLHFWLKMIWFWLPTSFGTSVWRAPFWTVTRPCGAYPPGTTMALETSSQTRRSYSGRTTFPDWDGWYVANSNKIGGWIFWLVQGGTNDGRKRVRWNKSCCWGGYCSSWRWRHG